MSEKNKYSDSDLAEFKTLIEEKLIEARKDLEMLNSAISNDNNGTEDTSPSFKMMEDGSDTLSREETSQLAARQEKFINSLNNALIRIKNKTYGVCRESGNLISKARLRIVPHATLSIEAKNKMG
jgi:RNA polymerase-binding transcription factor DksA